jgi:hypothetical protein
MQNGKLAALSDVNSFCVFRNFNFYLLRNYVSKNSHELKSIFSYEKRKQVVVILESTLLTFLNRLNSQVRHRDAKWHFYMMSSLSMLM